MCVCECRQMEEKPPKSQLYAGGRGGEKGTGTTIICQGLLQYSLACFSAGGYCPEAFWLTGPPPLKVAVSSTAWFWGYQHRRRERGATAILLALPALPMNYWALPYVAASI